MVASVVELTKVMYYGTFTLAREWRQSRRIRRRVSEEAPTRQTDRSAASPSNRDAYLLATSMTRDEYLLVTRSRNDVVHLVRPARVRVKRN